MRENLNANEQSTETSQFGNVSSLTQEKATESNAIQIPSISLPKGGGALKGIDEKFEVNSANGTAGFTIPLPLSPGRSGFTPSLSLSYNSGGGNGPFGLGWSLNYPSIQRKTDKQLPRYQQDEEDVFMFMGVEDLVPFLEKSESGKYIVKEHTTSDRYIVKRYRSRIESGFSRIEKIYHPQHGTYWKVTSGDNIATIFGRNKEARIADPKDASRIFQWLPEFSYDDKGNWIQYHYKKDTNIDKNGEIVNDDSIPEHLYEKNRKSGLAAFTQTYLKRVTYGNRKAYYVDPIKPYDPQLPEDKECFFELVLDHGEHIENKPTPQYTSTWYYRKDAFSTYRSGFEIRTNRLCKRILMFHHFKDEKQFVGTPDEEVFGENYLVRSLELIYEPSSINNSGQTEVTYLKSAIQIGYIRKPDGTYSNKSLPPVEFIYQKLNWNKEIRKVSEESMINAPVGLTNNYQWVDLYGEGISGILTEQGTGWYYKSNLGDREEDGNVTFTRAKEVFPKPSLSGLGQGVLSIQDLEANGEKQVVVQTSGVQGYYELTEENEWKNFQPFTSIANINLQDPNTRLLDLNGDGQPELVMTEEQVFVWHAADGKKGHLPANYVHKVLDEEQGPAIVFADAEQTIFLADMSGDGLTDIVRIRNSEICYWANMGYGKFSAKVSMNNAPIFDHQDHFNPRYLHLADVSGTGATDIIYTGQKRFKAYINLSGNAWSDVHEINPSFPIDSNSQFSVVDLLGTGTSCMVWSSDLPSHAHEPMQYIDLMDSKKPHVLTHYKNNFGKETTIHYKSSTHFYLKDKLEGKPWITKLPFPVQVVSKMVMEEKITDVRFTSEYRYHHGYYDHAEREFRGFGMVEQADTEFYPEWQENNAANQLEKAEALYQKPILTKTWFHTGAFIDREQILRQFEKEYWYEVYNQQFPDDPIVVNELKLQDARLSDTIVDLHTDEFREAIRACKGMMLRQEVFALDATNDPSEEALKLQAKPYSVATHNCNIQLVQPRNINRYGVFLVTESEAIAIQYERDETDPRISHTLNTKIDELGNVLESASVVYGRNLEKAEIDFKELSESSTDFSEDVLDDTTEQKTQLQTAFAENLRKTQEEQIKTHIIYTQNTFAKYNEGTSIKSDIDLPEVYRLRLPYETKTYEITGAYISGTIFQLQDFQDILTNTSEIAYHQLPSTGLQSRLIEHVKTRYSKDNFTTLDFGFYDILGLPFENYQLAYTLDLVKQLYTKEDETELEANGRTASKLIETEGNYTNLGGNLWIRSGITHFLNPEYQGILEVKERFFLPIAFEDPFGAITSVQYDTETFTNHQRNNDGYYLFIKETKDALGSKVLLDRFNYRTLSPSRMIDPNANPSSVLVDELGLVKALAVEGNGNYTDDAQQEVALLQQADSLEGITEYYDADEVFITNGLVEYEGQITKEELQFVGKIILKQATARFLYNFNAYEKTGNQPTLTVGITREEHYADNPNSTVRYQFEYSDGTGNVVMSKSQAEPGLAYTIKNGVRIQIDTGEELRWIGNGRTVLNNKGNPVKQYEPYFSTYFLYENDARLVEIGVTPILYYDALGRQIKTELPNGTFTKVAFDSWKQSSFDPNDTVLESQWYHDRINRTIDEQLIAEGKDPEKEQQAAEKAALHANTPTSVYLDSLGRPVLSVGHNEKDTAGNHKLYTTFIELDIEGNAKTILDARGNQVMQYGYNMLGHRVYQESMDAGKRWSLHNLMGNPIYSWDNKEQIFSTNYDVLQRPMEMYIHTQGNQYLFEKIEYGQPTSPNFAKNLNGQVIHHYDSSGKITNVAVDFKGNSLEVTRQLVADYQTEIIDWSIGSTTNQLEEEIFTSITEYDALNRMTRLYNWHRSKDRVTIYEPSYNERGVLQAEDHITDAQITNSGYEGGRRVTAVAGIQLNEKGQRTQLRYGNGTTTKYHYDATTFRLVQLRTTKGGNQTMPDPPSHLSDPNVLQNLYYTYDPVGNIMEIEDDAYEPVFFNNQQVDPKSRYTYDASYRLIQATGRENKSFDQAPKALEPNIPQVNLPQTDQTLRNYTQSYHYDPVGNILSMRHVATTERWTRRYAYDTKSNRLLQTWTGNNPTNTIQYQYDAHGSMLNYNNTPEEFLPHWDYKERVHHIDLGGGGKAYYQYDTGLERSRKRIIKGNIIEERLYLGGMEVYRRWQGTMLVEEIETHHLFVDDQRILLVENIVQTDNTQLTTGILDRYQYSNHLGSVGIELNGNGAIISYEEYHPYGTVAYQASNKAIKTVAKRYRYTGMERDTESGLNYHSARYYLPWLGRWLSTDPIGVEGGMNLYGYSNSNPIMYGDLKGTQPVQTPVLMSTWDYNKKVPNRSSIGHNVQRDHPIQISLRAEQRGRTGAQQRRISAQRAELTILAETGKGRFHTEVGRLQREIRLRYRAGAITSESQLIQETQAAYTRAGQVTGTTINEKALNTALLSNLGVQSESYEQTRIELAQQQGPTTVTDESIDRAFRPYESVDNEPDSETTTSPSSSALQSEDESSSESTTRRQRRRSRRRTSPRRRSRSRRRSSRGTTRRLAGGAGLGAIGAAVVPGAAEVSEGLAAAAILATGHSSTAALAAPLMAAAEAVPVVAAAGAIGAGAGLVAREVATAVGADEDIAEGAGVVAAVAAGAAVGSIIPGVGTLVGAGIGAIAGGVGYLLTR